MEVLGPAKVDFGAYPAWEQRVAEYRVRNAGDEPIFIVRLRETCEGCAHATCTRKLLMPGDDAFIRITVPPNSLAGRFEKTLYVESTNSSARFVPLLFAGNAIPIVEVKPANYIYIGRIGTNEVWHQTFQLAAMTNGVKLGQPIVETSNRVSMAFGAASNFANDCSELTVTVLPSPDPCDMCCTVKVPIIAPTGHPPVEVSVAGKIGLELVAVPGLIYVPSSEIPVKKRFRLKVLGGDGFPMDLAALQMPRCEGVEFRADPSRETNGGVVVTARFGPEFIQKLHLEKRIILTIRLPDVAPARLICESGDGQ